MSADIVRYVGPPITVVYQSAAGLIAAVAALLSAAGVIVVRAGRFFKNWKFWALVGLLLSVAVYFMGHRRAQEGDHMRVIVLGMDGLDPRIVRTMMAAGELPALRKLSAAGMSGDLATTLPPQSPVAWASFLTGMNPGRHGVYDFLRRDPSTYMPDVGLTVPRQPRTLKIGPYRIPLGETGFTPPLKSPYFWDHLTRRGIPVTVLRCPLTFPSTPVTGRMLSGLGTPDVRGTQGVGTYYATEQGAVPDDGTMDRVSVTAHGDTIETFIRGPRDSTRADAPYITVPLRVRIDGAQQATVSVQGATYTLKAGVWSAWVRVRFPTGPFSTVSGICRFFLRSAAPSFGLYLAPVNIDPSDPSLPISSPRSFARTLARDIGPYRTVGQPGDTWGFDKGVVPAAAAVAQYGQVLDEDTKILFHELANFHEGLLFCYFGVPDTVQHMFRPGAHGDPVAWIYREMDRVVGEVAARAGTGTTIIVLSDHGFGPYRRMVHMNAWLRDRGYLVLRAGEESSGAFFENVDWTATRAYALGLSGIYINMKGRERDGIVLPHEAAPLAAEIARQAEQLRDPSGGETVITRAYLRDDVYRGGAVADAPDVIIGFRPGWRASWQTALGAVPRAIVEDNTRAWQGDHIFDPSAVPGILLTNRPLRGAHPRIIDIAPTILKLFDVPVPSDMDGEPLL